MFRRIEVNNIRNIVCVTGIFIGTHFGLIFGVKYLIKKHKINGNSKYVTWTDISLMLHGFTGGIFGGLAGGVFGYNAPLIFMSIPTGVLVTMILAPTWATIVHKHINFQDHFEYMTGKMKNDSECE